MNKQSMLLLSAGIFVGLLIGFFSIRWFSSSPTLAAQTAGASPGSSALAAGGHDAAHLHGSESPEETDWCSEHWVPESVCTKCKPDLVEAFKSQGNWCGEHGYPESHCRKCNPRLTFPQEPRPSQTSAADETGRVSVFFPPNDKTCTPEQALIQFASAETTSEIGVKTEFVLPAAAGSAIEAPAELVFNDTKTVAVTTTLPATVVRWRVDPGNSLASGRELAELESPEMVQLKASYLEAEADWNLADAQFRRAGDLHTRNLISQAEYQDAEAHARVSQSRLEGIAGRLRSAGLREADFFALKSDRQISPRWLLCSANDGTLLERRAPLGELLAAGSTLALIGQSSALWIEAHIRERDLSQFRKGMKVEFTIDGEEFSRATGTIIWVAEYLDPHTRTGLVRAELTSDPKNLKAHMFGRIRLTKAAPQSAVLVSKDAVQWEGCCHVVFIQEAIDRYRPRKVSIERGDRQHYLVTSGLKAGEVVVTDGSFLLKSELQKESLGVGCAGE